MFARIKTLFLDLLFPARCVGCGREGSFLCSHCAQSLSFLPPACIGCGMMTPQDNARPAGHTCLRCRKKTPVRLFLSPFAYKHQLTRRLLHEFKYRRIRSLSGPIADLLVSYMRYYRVPLSADMLMMPVPLHPRRQRVRGFNQATLIARDIGKRTFLPLNDRALIRTVSRVPQTGLSAKKRQANVAHIFSLRDPAAVAGKTIILLDDVKTTGATLEQAARVIKKAGAKEVWAMTFAH